MNPASGTIIYLLIFVALIYFLMIRPQQVQQKRRREMLEKLKVNDHVVLAGGIHGRIIKLKESSIIMRISDKVEIEVDKGGVAYVPSHGGEES